MKKICFAALLTAFTLLTAYASPLDLRRFGIGVFLGAPTGISIGFYANENNVINGVIGWSLERNSSLFLTLDYTHRWPVSINVGKLFLYAGIGGHLKVSERPDLGIRIPLGVSFFTPEIPLDIFFELAPGIMLIPSTSPFLDGGIGIRWRF